MAGSQLVEFVKIMPDGRRVWNGNRIGFDDAALDAFGNQRVTQPVTLMDSQLQYGDQPLTWLSKITDTSAVERDVSATAISGGIVGPGGYVPGSGVGSNVVPAATLANLLSRLPIALDIDGNHPTTPLTDVLSIVAVSLAGATNVGAAMNWREIK